jgi:hypothetical protein
MTRAGGVRKRKRIEWCRRGESNPRPRDYETLALPLSYAGTKTILYATELIVNVSSIRAKPPVADSGK